MPKRTKLKTNRKFSHKVILLTVLGFGVVGAIVLALSYAATPSASLTVSPLNSTYTVGNSATISVYEDSGSQAINSVSIGLNYDANKLDFQSVSTASSAFAGGGCPDHDGGSGNVTITCFLYPTGSPSTLSGRQLVGTVSFKIKAAGSTNITFAKESAEKSGIFLAGTGENIWNGTTTGGSYTLSAGSTNPGTGGGSGGGGSSGGSSTPTTGGGSSTGSSGSGGSNTPTTGGTKPSGGTSNASNTSQVPSTTNGPPSTSQPITSTGQPGQTVTVTVTDKDGHPAGGVTVKLDSLEATTDISGVVTFSGVSAGKHKLSATNSILGAASRSITVADNSNPNIALKLGKTPNYLLYVALGILVILLLVAARLVARWLHNRAENSRRFVGYQTGPDNSTKIEPANNAPAAVVAPRPESDDTEEKEALQSIKPKVESTDTLETIERKVGAKKAKPAPAADTASSNDFEPNLVLPSKKPAAKPADSAKA
jgi:hypothetical protein